MNIPATSDGVSEPVDAGHDVPPHERVGIRLGGNTKAPTGRVSNPPLRSVFVVVIQPYRGVTRGPGEGRFIADRIGHFLTPRKAGAKGRKPDILPYYLSDQRVIIKKSFGLSTFPSPYGRGKWGGGF